MAGLVSGLDLAEAITSLPNHIDSDFARELLLVFEGAFVSAVLAQEAEAAEANKGKPT